jgi:Nucleotide modification associated domain 3
MNALLVRIGADLSAGGGHWNGPVDSRSNEFVYVPIPETKPVRAGMEKPYKSLVPALSNFGVSLPAHLVSRQMHLDPDFDYLTVIFGFAANSLSADNRSQSMEPSRPTRAALRQSPIIA